MKPVERSPVSYSDGEARMLKILRARKTPIDTLELCKVWFNGTELPLNARSRVTSVLRTLSHKMAYNREPYRVAKTARNGPHPVFYSLQKANKK